MPRAQKHPAQHRLALEKLQLEVALKRQKLKAAIICRPKITPSTPELKRIKAVLRANESQKHLVSAQTRVATENIALMQSKLSLTRLLKQEGEVTEAFVKEETERRAGYR